MFRKLLLALAAAFFILSGQTSFVYQTSGSGSETTKVDPNEMKFFLNLGSVRHLVCGKWTGTGEIINNTTVMTANHVVVGNTLCMDMDSGAIGHVAYRSPRLDIATIIFQPNKLPQGIRIPYSCAGFEEGKTYYTVGWEQGQYLVVNKLVSTSKYAWTMDFKSGTFFNHTRVLKGYIIPGMSGGPIYNDAGEMVGMNNATSHWGIAYAREIKDTYLCHAKPEATVEPMAPIDIVHPLNTMVIPNVQFDLANLR